MEIPIVKGVQIRDEDSHHIADLGQTSTLKGKHITKGVLRDHPDATVGYSFPLIFEFSGST